MIELLNEAEQVAMRFQVYRCWPSAYTAVGELDASVSEMAIESITLQHEGWERDRETGEPAEESYSTGSDGKRSVDEGTPTKLSKNDDS